MAKSELITAARLRELLHYDPETGIFMRRVTTGRHGRYCAGEVAGRNHNDYSSIGVDDCEYKAHRLAWLYMTGRWPEGPLDHINMVKADNRFCNLRLATKTHNTANIPARGRSGLKGTYRTPGGRWQAKIMVDGKSIWLCARRTSWLAGLGRIHGSLPGGSCRRYGAQD
jgi:hypothetical protein